MCKWPHSVYMKSTEKPLVQEAFKNTRHTALYLINILWRLPGPVRSRTAAAAGCGLRIWAGTRKTRLISIHTEALRYWLITSIKTITRQTYRGQRECGNCEWHKHCRSEFMSLFVCRTWKQVIVVTVAVRAGATVGAAGPLPLPGRWQQGQLRWANRALANPCATVASVAVLGGAPWPFRGSSHFLVLLGEEDRCPTAHLRSQCRRGNIQILKEKQDSIGCWYTPFMLFYSCLLMFYSWMNSRYFAFFYMHLFR